VAVGVRRHDISREGESRSSLSQPGQGEPQAGGRHGWRHAQHEDRDHGRWQEQQQGVGVGLPGQIRVPRDTLRRNCRGWQRRRRIGPRLRGGPAVPVRAVYVRLELLGGESELLVHLLDGDGQRGAGGHWHAELQVNTAAAGGAERPGGGTGRVAAVLGLLAELAGKMLEQRDPSGRP
jgi:hypothetical protein